MSQNLSSAAVEIGALRVKRSDSFFLIPPPFHNKCYLSMYDYSKYQGPQESFRIIGSSNDRKREFSDVFGKSRMLPKNVKALPEFATSTRVFREVFGTCVQALKKMSSLEVVASSSLMLCRIRSLLTSTLFMHNNIDNENKG